MAAPSAEKSNINTCSENGSFFHGHLINLSVGCLIDICYFIDNHLHVRGTKKRKPAHPSAETQAIQRIQEAAAQLENNAQHIQHLVNIEN